MQMGCFSVMGVRSSVSGLVLSFILLFADDTIRSGDHHMSTLGVDCL